MLCWWDHCSDPTQQFQCPYRSAFTLFCLFVSITSTARKSLLKLDLMEPCSFVVGYNYTCNKYLLLYLIFKFVLKAQFCPVVSANHGLDMGTASIRLRQIFCGCYTAQILLGNCSILIPCGVMRLKYPRNNKNNMHHMLRTLHNHSITLA